MKRQLFFTMLALSMISISSFAQRRELRTESNGFQWYEDITSNGDRSASDVNGNVLIPFSRGYDFLCFHPREKTTGYFTVRSKGKSGACDVTGKEIIPPIYNNVVFFEREMIGGYYGIELNGKKGACDIEGNVVIEPKYDNVVFHIKETDIVGYYSVELDGKKGACDMKGHEVIPPKKYDKLYFISRNNAVGYYSVYKNGLQGACDITGKEIVHCKYKTLIYSSYSDCFSYKDDTGNWVNLKIRLDKDGLLIK